MEVSEQNFSNLGFLFVSLSDEDIAPIKDEISELKENFDEADRFNYGLAGHLNYEFRLSKSKNYVEKLLLPLTYEYRKRFPHYKCKEDGYILENTWVNFQKKHEFNPVHFHFGIFSFALWIKVPYYIDDELNHFPHLKQEENKTANFCFQYIDALGEICGHPIPADRDWENKLVFFPAKMRHFVNPFFTSNEYRISVSGNFL